MSTNELFKKGCCGILLARTSKIGTPDIAIEEWKGKGRGVCGLRKNENL